MKLKIFILLVFYSFPAYIFSQTFFQKVTVGSIATDNNYGVNSAWGDYDNDGFQDIVISQYTDSCSNCYFPLYLYHNDGNGTFTRVLNNAISNTQIRCIGIAWGDYDNDGKLDLFAGAANYGNNMLFHNEGNGVFTRVTAGVVVNEGGNSRSCGWADYDRDGWLDLFVNNGGGNVNDFLYHNNHDGTFSKIITSPVANDASYGRGCCWGDYDNDGWPDLFVATYQGQNDLLYHNNNGTFAKITSGPVVNDGGWDTQCRWFDFDNDGYLDLIVTIQDNINRLYHNERNGTFTLSSVLPNLTSTGHYGVACGDYDNNGWQDLTIGRSPSVSLLYKNVNGISFARIQNEQVASISSSDGGWADYNNDGKLDLFTTFTPHNSLYKNVGNTGNYLICKLTGCSSNKCAIGAKVKIKIGSSIQIREISSGDGNEDMLWAHFGLGLSTIIDSMIVNWPSGNIQRLAHISANQTISIDECTIGIQPISSEIPNQFSLSQNYPNPFNPSTKIKFDIPAGGAQYIVPVQLSIYDALGREVTTLVNERLNPGTYKVQWDASRYPSGVYFYKLIIQDFSETKKMVLVK